MADYAAPVAEMEFVLRHLAGLPEVCALPKYRAIGADDAGAVLAEAARFARGVLAPLNARGDREGARLVDGGVRAAPGYAEAYRAFTAAGWNGLSMPEEYGGQGLPRVLAVAVEEMWNGADLSFALAPMLTSGVVSAIAAHGSADQRALYLPPLVAGRWCGTMNLTEPQAGSDLSAVRTTATPEGGAFRLRGTKVFITWGDHDLAENIVHLVLARLPDAPDGVRGMSLFAVPKRLVRDDGSCGERNDIACVALEHKVGIHASPTCVLSYGDGGGAIGHLVGEPSRGLEYMFTTMNHARLAVGLEGVALAERAYQAAAAYAFTRVQGREAGGASRERVPIVRHPDVKRMLLSMKCRVAAMRALAYYAAAAGDLAAAHPADETRRRWQSRADLLTPVVKGWCTEQAVDIASIGMQVHGGYGYVEETGIAQHWRDARITPIYEGTTGIQANDLVGRKLAGDGGAAAEALFEDMRADVTQAASHEALRAAAEATGRAIAALEQATASVLRRPTAEAAAVAVPCLELFGTVAGAWMVLRAAAAALRHADDPAARLAALRYYSTHVLPKSLFLAMQVEAGGSAVLDYPEDALR